MFKKSLLIVSALVFAFGILMASVYQTSTQAVTDNMESESLETETTESGQVDEEEEMMVVEKVEYNLAWPGILPDHFLYPVKMIRDRIWLFLTNDVLRKGELMVKLADKRILASSLLLDKGKEELAISTATKGEKYLEQAVAQAKTAKEKGEDVTAFLEKLSLSVQKHEEVLREMQTKAGEEGKGLFDQALGYPRNVSAEVQKLLAN